MKTNELVIVCGDIGALVSSMKMNYSLGYGVCETIESVDGLYRATLSQGADTDYVDKLNSFDVEKDDLSTLTGNVAKVITPIEVEEVEQASVTITKRPRGSKK